jgi:hypothetical protein
MIDRRAFLSTPALVAAPLAAAAQPTNKIPRIGCLSQASAEIAEELFASFRQELRELGLHGRSNDRDGAAIRRGTLRADLCLRLQRVGPGDRWGVNV